MQDHRAVSTGVVPWWMNGVVKTVRIVRMRCLARREVEDMTGARVFLRSCGRLDVGDFII